LLTKFREIYSVDAASQKLNLKEIIHQHQGRIYLIRSPRLIHLWGPLSHCCVEKNGMR